MTLLEKIRLLDVSLENLKDAWAYHKQHGLTLPEDLVRLLKDVEKILQETILLDEQNQHSMQASYQNTLLAAKPKTIQEDNLLRAKKAYSHTPHSSSKESSHA